MPKASRQLLIATRIGAEVSYLWLDRSFDHVWHQHTYRVFGSSLSLDRMYMSSHIDTDEAKLRLRQWYTNFEPPTLDEGVVHIFTPAFKVGKAK
jgi:hypothetical protein